MCGLRQQKTSPFYITPAKISSSSLRLGSDSLQHLSEFETIDYSQPQTYTPRILADKILTSRSSIEGERKLVTVFFANLATRIEASAAKGLTPFVGRKNSMATLMGVYENARAGFGQVVGIVGEAGVGKSRLLLEFTNLLPEGEFTYLEGRCLHYGGSMSYPPLRDIIKSYFGINDDDNETETRKKLKTTIEVLDEGLSAGLAPLQELLSVAVERDEFAALDSCKILLLLMYRQEYSHHWGNRSFYTRIGLTQLGTPSSIQLIQAILTGDEIAPEIKELIIAKAAGNPLFIEEFTHTLLENGTIKCADHYMNLHMFRQDNRINRIFLFSRSLSCRSS
jgi:hypothetical protein